VLSVSKKNRHNIRWFATYVAKFEHLSFKSVSIRANQTHNEVFMLNNMPSESVDTQLLERVKQIATLLDKYKPDLLQADTHAKRVKVLQASATLENIELSEEEAEGIIQNDYPDQQNETLSFLKAEAKNIASKVGRDAVLMYLLPSVFVSQSFANTAKILLAPLFPTKVVTPLVLAASLTTHWLAPSYAPSALGASLLEEGFEQFGSGMYLVGPLATGVFFHYGEKFVNRFKPQQIEKATNRDTPAKPAL